MQKKEKINKTCLIMGGGQMGVALAYAMSKLGYYVLIEEQLDSRRQYLEKFFNDNNINGDILEYFYTLIILFNENDIDIVISALPYHQNFKVAKQCIDNNVNYCDLGGNVTVSGEIKNYYKKKQKDTTSVVFTDLGLAPGWVNILAEEGLEKVCRDHSNDCVGDFVINEINQITMMAGGIPITWNPADLLNYNVNWSIYGLINEYTDDVTIIRLGKKKIIKPLDDILYETIAGYDLESFPTSGGLAHTENIITNKPSISCEYRTLRWPGHCCTIKNLLRLGPELFKKVLQKHENIQKKNMVVAQTTVSSKELTWKKTINVIDDNILTAMQKCTAFPAAAVADYIVQRDLYISSFANGVYMEYYHINLKTFHDNLRKLFNGNKYYV